MRTRVDLLIHNGTVLSHPNKLPHANTTIAVRNGLILDVGPQENLAQQYESPQTIDATNCLVMPGLINTHTHLAMSCFRGLGDDQHLMEWLQGTIFPAESKLTAEQVFWSTQLSLAEMIRSGTTSFCDMYLFEHEVARATEIAGLRGLLGEGLFGFPSPNYGAIDAGFAYTERLIQTWQGHPLIRIGVMPHAPYTCPSALLELAASTARKFKVPLSIHLAETRYEEEQSRLQHGASPVEYLDHLGLLGPDLIAAHCVTVSPSDMDLLALRGVRVAHNPESNMKLASGVAPVPEMLARGIPVGLGTDGSASNNDLDMFSEMDFASKLQKVHRLDSTALPAAQTLHMATLGGADVLGLSQKVGSLEPGKACDAIILELHKPHLQPFYHHASQLVYAARGSDVRDTIVQGRILMRNRQLLTLDEDEIFARMKVLQDKVLKDLGRTP